MYNLLKQTFMLEIKTKIMKSNDGSLLFRASSQGGADHMFGMSRSALGGEMVMMDFHHSSLTIIRCRLANNSPLEPISCR